MERAEERQAAQVAEEEPPARRELRPRARDDVDERVGALEVLRDRVEDDRVERLLERRDVGRGHVAERDDAREAVAASFASMPEIASREKSTPT